VYVNSILRPLINDTETTKFLNSAPHSFSKGGDGDYDGLSIPTRYHFECPIHDQSLSGRAVRTDLDAT
jgi:hypothetical protein